MDRELGMAINQIRKEYAVLYRRDPTSAEEMKKRMLSEEGEEFTTMALGPIDGDTVRPSRAYQVLLDKGPLYYSELEYKDKQQMKAACLDEIFGVRRFVVDDDYVFFIEGQEESVLYMIDKYNSRGEVAMRFIEKFMGGYDPKEDVE